MTNGVNPCYNITGPQGGIYLDIMGGIKYIGVGGISYHKVAYYIKVAIKV